MFGFVSGEAAAAATAGDVLGVLLYLDAHPQQLHNRTIFQSELIHIAARNGHCVLLEELLKRGADINALDFGGMRRTALHWACLMGHVDIVEQLIAHGADTKVQEKSWAKLVKEGQRCGKQIDNDAPLEAPEALCRNSAVRLALQRPPWTPSVHAQWPPRFRGVTRLLAAASGVVGISPAREDVCAIKESAEEGRAQAGARWVPLDLDVLKDILARAAYPVSAWV
ncbi:hypothetical protein WJX81_003636 [Elliptochloris bilobata]|uniref:Uncharacterized protein n=1 Tax=Elliptochloris bilobata TaxID=381761 RepID=A0AAW1QA66_9CHLO